MSSEHPFVERFKQIYSRNYKKFFIVPALAVLFCLGVIAWNYYSTGELVSTGIDLKGGIIVTVGWNFSSEPSIASMKTALISENLEKDISISRIDAFASGKIKLRALQFEAPPEADPVKFTQSVRTVLSSEGFETDPVEYNVKIVGPAVGKVFLSNTYIAMAMGFFFLGVVIFFIFKKKAVIATVISCIFFDFLGGLATMNILGIKLSPITLASLLMLIGFSIDSDILITTAVLKNREGPAIDRAIFAMKTGITMALAASASLTALYILSGTAVLKDMTVILLGGLFFDLIHTWFTNLGVLFLIAEKESATGAQHQ
ncbi:MAG: hypothetical protein V1820_01515 [archaeon]